MPSLVTLLPPSGPRLGPMPVVQARAWAAAAGSGVVAVAEGELRMEGPPADPLPAQVVTEFPALVAACYQLLLAETHPFTRVHRLVDTFTAVIELLAIVQIEDALRLDVRSDDLLRCLRERLPRPLTSAWVELFEAARKAVRATRRPLFLQGAARLRLTALCAPLLRLRNEYAHGAVPAEETCVADFASGLPRLHALLAAVAFLRQHPLVEVREGRARRLTGVRPGPWGEVAAPEGIRSQVHGYLLLVPAWRVAMPRASCRAPATPACLRDGLATGGLAALAAAEPHTWQRRLVEGVPGRVRWTLRTTLLDVGRAGAWGTPLPTAAKDTPQQIARRRQRFARLARARGARPVLAVGERDLDRIRAALARDRQPRSRPSAAAARRRDRIRAALARDRQGRERDPGVVHAEMNFLRYINWNLQAEVTHQPRIGATEAPRPQRQPLWVEAGTVERLLRGRPSARTLAALACALSKVREAEARRCRVRNQTPIQGRLGIQPLMRRDGRRIPSRFALVPGWARPLLLPWAAACRAAGLRDEDCAFASEDDPRRPVSGLAHLLDAACRQVGLPPIRWQDWGRIREVVRPEVIAAAVRSAL